MKLHRSPHSHWLACVFVISLSSACSDPPAKQNPPEACEPGALGCECGDGAVCDDSLICVNAICIPDEDADPDAGMNPDPEPDDDVMEPDPNPDPDPDPDPVGELGLLIDQESARACEVVLRDTEHKIAQVVFADSLEGRSMRRGERLAIAFISTEDAPITENAAGFVLGEGADGIEGVEVISGRCADGTGAFLDTTRIDLSDKR